MRSSERGVSLIEVVIASAILGGLTLMSYLILFSSTETYESQAAHLKLDARARESLEEIARTLRMSDGDYLWNGSPYTKLTPKEETSDLVFYLPGAFEMDKFIQNGNRVVLNQSYRLRWICDEKTVDGLDNDNDGLVDEGYVERTEPSGAPTRLCSDVPYQVGEYDAQMKKTVLRPGFVFSRDQGVVTITLNVETLDPRVGRVPVDPLNPAGASKRRTILRRAQTSVELRN